MDIKILCYRCKQAYESAGYIVRRVPNNKIKDKCEICTRLGFEYYAKGQKRKCVNTNGKK